MHGLTDYLTECCWEDIIIAWYVLVDDAYEALQSFYGAWRHRGPDPGFVDSEVITVGLICDVFFGGKEKK